MLALLSPAATHWHCQISKPFAFFWKVPSPPSSSLCDTLIHCHVFRGFFQNLICMFCEDVVESHQCHFCPDSKDNWSGRVKPRRASAWPTFYFCSSSLVFVFCFFIWSGCSPNIYYWSMEYKCLWPGPFLKSNIESYNGRSETSRPANMSHTVAFQGFHMDSHRPSLLLTASYTYCMNTDKMLPGTLCDHICMSPNGWRQTSAGHLLVIREDLV